MPSPSVRHDGASHRFVLDTPDGPAELGYRRHGSTITFTHTSVPPEQRGDGKGGELVEAGLAYARENRLTVDPQCPFVAAYVGKHPESQDLLT